MSTQRFRRRPSSSATYPVAEVDLRLVRRRGILDALGRRALTPSQLVVCVGAI
jgi:hypothetical protein